MRMTLKEKEAFEKEKQLTFNKIKKHLEKYEPWFEVTPTSSEWFYILNCKFPEAKRKPDFEDAIFSSIFVAADCVRFIFLPAEIGFGLMDDAPSLNQYHKRSTVFKFYNSKQVDEKELEIILKKGLQLFKDSGYII